VLLVFTCFACDEDRALVDAAGRDAGGAEDAAAVPDGLLPSILPPEEPAPPSLPECLRGEDPPGCAELPRLADWECPKGWLSTPLFEPGDVPDGLQQVVACEPPPVPSSCRPGHMPRVGREACVPIGGPCPAGTYPKAPGVPEELRVYVVGGARGGDGSPDRPLGSMAEAVAAAPAGGAVVIGAGTFFDSITIGRDLALIGACATQSTLEALEAGSGPEAPAIMVLPGAHVTVSNLHVRAVDSAGVMVFGQDSRVTLIGVWLEALTEHGVYVEGGEVELDGCLVDGVGAGPLGDSGRGVFATDGATLRMHQSVVRRGSMANVLVVGGYADQPTRAELAEVWLRDAQGLPDGSLGWGLAALDGAEVTARRTIADDNRAAGIAVYSGVPGVRTAMELEDVAVRDTLPDGDQRSGYGILASSSAGGTVQLSGRRLLLERNHETGLIVAPASAGAQASAEIEGLVVRQTAPVAEARRGYGVAALDGARVTLRQALLADNEEMGLFIEGVVYAGTVVDLEDVIVRRTRGSAGRPSTAVVARTGSLLTMSRALLDEGTGAALLALGEGDGSGAQVEAADLTVYGPDPSLHPDGAYGVAATHDASLRIERATFRRNLALALVGKGSGGKQGARLDLLHILVADIARAEAREVGGALAVGFGASATVQGLVVLRARNTAIWAGGSGGGSGWPAPHLEIVDAEVRQTLPLRGDLKGVGFMLSDGATGRLERVRVVGGRRVGVVVSGAGDRGPTSLAARDLIVTGVRADAEDLYGTALEVVGGARADVLRARFSDNQTGAVIVDWSEGTEPTQATFDHLRVADTLSRPDGTRGIGVLTQYGGLLRIRDGVVEGSRDMGAVAYARSDAGVPARLELERVVVRDSRVARCAQLDPADVRWCGDVGSRARGGHGLAVVLGAEAEADGLLVAGSDTVGVLIAYDGRATLRNTTITDNAIGLSIFAADANASALGDEVYLFGNRVDFAHQEVALPDPLENVGRLEVPGLEP